MLEINKIYNEDCLEGMLKIKTESVDLAICDPPYFKVINQKWDYQWRTEPEYVEWCKTWLSEVHRTLRKGGSLYLFGYFRNLSYLVPVLETIGFELRQQIIINKGIRAIGGRATKNYKMFPNVTESLLFLIKDSKPFVRDFLKQRQKKLGLSSKQINEALNVKSNGGGMWSIYTGKNLCEQLPTKELWNKLQTILCFDLPYEKIGITFNTEMGITDVWDDINFYEEKRIHPTQKPLKLINRIVKASSNEGDLILDPFLGSGNTIKSCLNNKRNFIGFDISLEYYESINELYNQ
jgi:DNA modification methylase